MLQLPDQLPFSRVYALNFSSWKRQSVRQCFPGRQVVFINNPAAVPANAVLLVWGMQPLPSSVAENIKVLRVEDGFLRSVGLGADLIKPLSWVIDGRGIYYNATQPSDLEYLLANTTFPAATLHRAALLRQRIVQQGLSKYNLGTSSWQRPESVNKVILVTGQVESDASLQYGTEGIRTNIALLQKVRATNPQAYLLYKPHPDVLAGLRAKGQAEDTASQYCDELVSECDMGDLLNKVDAVHVLTSLSGFEALLRGKTVYCYGTPFYAGWGLTIDSLSLPRRSRQLSIDELVAGVLIDYPYYLSRDGKSLMSPEAALAELQHWRQHTKPGTPWWRKGFRIILRQIVGVS